MRYIALTGAAVDRDGRQIGRADLMRRCRAAGIIVHKSVRPLTDTLVASRTDTRKARAAQARGLRVVAYPDLLAEIENRAA